MADESCLNRIWDYDCLAWRLFVSNDKIVASCSGDADKLIVKSMYWSQDPGDNYSINLFEFKKRVFRKHYSQSQVIALNSEGDP